MHLEVQHSSIITYTMAARKGPLWAIPLILLCLGPVTWGCKPAPKETYNPMCQENPSIAKICLLRLTRCCPNLFLSDFHTSQSNSDSHDNTNFGFINWNSNIGLHGQSSLVFFFVGYACAVATMMAVQRCRQSRRHKRTMQELLSKIASTSASAAQNIPARPAMLPLFPRPDFSLEEEQAKVLSQPEVPCLSWIMQGISSPSPNFHPAHQTFIPRTKLSTSVINQACDKGSEKY